MNNNFNIISAEQIPFYNKLEKYNRKNIAKLLTNMSSTMSKNDFSRYMYYFYIYNVPYNPILQEHNWASTTNTMLSQDWFNYCVQYADVIVSYMIEQKIQNDDHLINWLQCFRSVNIRENIDLFEYCATSPVCNKWDLALRVYAPFDNHDDTISPLNNAIFKMLIYSGDTELMEKISYRYGCNP